MTYPPKTIDLPCRLFRVQGGSFRLTPEAEFSAGQWAPVPRFNGPRYDRWTADLDLLPFLKGADGDLRFEWEVFVARLGGGVAFRMHDPLRVYPRGMGAGVWNPRHPNGRKALGSYQIDVTHHIDGHYNIDGGATFAYVAAKADRYADSILMSGLVPNAMVFKSGDHFETGGNLHMIVDDCQSDANGECRVPFLWKLWKPALVGDRINLHRPTARFILRSNDGGTLQRSGSSGQASIQATEVPYVD